MNVHGVHSGLVFFPFGLSSSGGQHSHGVDVQRCEIVAG